MLPLTVASVSPSAGATVVGRNVAASSGYADITGYVIPVKGVLRIAAPVVAGEETASITPRRLIRDSP